MARLRILPALAFLMLCAAPAWAQTYTESVLYNFCSQTSCVDGIEPQGQLTQGTDGNLYGATTNDGANSSGTVFKLTTDGTLTTLWAFCADQGCPDGVSPTGGLVQGTNGDFYGTTGAAGGNGGGGTVFKITSSGSLTTLYSFCAANGCTDGASSFADLLQGPDGDFYGVTEYGGANQQGAGGAGTVFKIGASGGFVSLYSFCSKANCADGQLPYGALVLGPGGDFYGTTQGGGAHSGGTVFKITSTGALTTIYSFCSQSDCADGEQPYGPLLLGSDGNFYGTTSAAGAHSFGTLFKMTPAGALTTLYTFCSQSGCTDGGAPIGALLLASDGNFYGVTTAGGNPAGDGTVYRFTPSGTFSTIYTFCFAKTTCTDGITPDSGLIQGKDGNLYGTTYAGGSGTTLDGGGETYGTVYKITGLKPPAIASISIAASPYPPTVGQPVTVTATLTGSSGTPSGTAKFTSGGNTLCTQTLSAGKATCDIATQGLTPGNYSVTVSYSGNSTYEASSGSASATLGAAPTTTTLTVNPDSVTPPAQVTLTATVKRSAAGALGTPGGTVSFQFGSTVLATAKVNSSGVATITGSTKGYSPGSYGLTAHYKGDTSDAASTSSKATLNLE